MYVFLQRRRSNAVHNLLLGADLLDRASAVQELSGVLLGLEATLVGLLHEELVALLLREPDRVLLGLEVELGACPAALMSRL